jgi:hypothetical protein
MKPAIILAAALALAGCNATPQKQIPVEDDAYFEQHSDPPEPKCVVNEWIAVQVCRGGGCIYGINVDFRETEESCWALIDRSPENKIPVCVPPYNPKNLPWCGEGETP